jgi:hypothetical protein
VFQEKRHGGGGVSAGIAGIEYVKRLFSRNGDVCGDVGCGVHLRVNGVSTSVS